MCPIGPKAQSTLSRKRGRFGENAPDLLEFAAYVEFHAQSILVRWGSSAAAHSFFPAGVLSGISRSDGEEIACPPTEQRAKMDNSESSAEAAGLAVTGAHGRSRPAIPVPADFVPLRLVLQPSGASGELTRADMLIGRPSQADHRPPLPDGSPRHCRLLFGEGRWPSLLVNTR